MVVEIGTPVVCGAFEATVELIGGSTFGVGHDVVHIALVGGDIASGRMLAVPVPNLDGPA
jgi:hypothetical protein